MSDSTTNNDSGDTIAQELNAQTSTIESYYCQKAVANNVGLLQDLVVPYYYDLDYPCSEDPAEGRQNVEASLLVRSQRDFLPDVSVCQRPQPIWFAKVSSLPPDEFANFPCQKLTGACCTVVFGQMSFTQLSPAEMNDMKRWIMDNLNDDTIAQGYIVSYLGSELPENWPTLSPNMPRSPTGSLPPAAAPTPLPLSVAAGNRDPEYIPPPKDGEFTMVGILILTGMIMIFVTTLALICKRRKLNQRRRDVDAAIAQSELALEKDGELVGEHIETATWEDPFEEHDIEVNVLSDSDNMRVRSISNISFKTREGSPHDNSLSPEGNKHYRFDLADTYKNSVMGSYCPDLFGPTQITVVPPYPMEENSESEADSWAQTDATVGSLEDDRPVVSSDTEVGEI